MPRNRQPGRFSTFQGRAESKQALYSRIVVHASVFEELKRNPQVWTHDGDRKGELKAVKGLLHHDVENGLYYIDYLRVMESELDNPEYYPECLEMFRKKVGELISETSHAEAISKLEWMQRYHRRIVQTVQRH